MDYQILIGDVNPGNIANLIFAIFKGLRDNKEYGVNLYISSLGGDLDSAIRFYDFVKATKLKINTYGFSQIDSAAVILFMTGAERTIVKNTRVRLHAPLYNLKAEDQVLSVISERLTLLNQIDMRYFEILSKQLGLPVEDIKSLYNKGKLLDESDLITYKIATKIVDTLPIL